MTRSALRSLQDNYHFLCPFTKSDVCSETARRFRQFLKAACKVKRENGSEAAVAISESSNGEASNQFTRWKG
jgi:hypothetical protein